MVLRYDQRYGTAANETLANTLGLAAVGFLSKYREGLFKFAQVRKIDIHMPSLDPRICGIGLDTAGDTWC